MSSSRISALSPKRPTDSGVRPESIAANRQIRKPTRRSPLHFWFHDPWAILTAKRGRESGIAYGWAAITAVMVLISLLLDNQRALTGWILQLPLAERTIPWINSGMVRHELILIFFVWLVTCLLLTRTLHHTELGDRDWSLCAIRDRLWIQGRIGTAGIAILFGLHSADWTYEQVDAHLFPEFVRDLGLAFVVAALVSGIFDIYYHRSQFGDHVQSVQAAVTGLQKLFGDISYYQTRLSHIRKSTSRVVILDDDWPIDAEWFDGAPIEDCRTVRALLSPEQQSHGENWQCVIAGRVPYPNPTRSIETPDIAFTGREFWRFIGVIWWLVAAQKLREQLRANYPSYRHDQIRVVVSDVPLQGSIIDDAVFVASREVGATGDTVCRGIEVIRNDYSTEMEGAHSRDASAATEFHRMIERYLLQVPSARRYVYSCLYLASMWREGLNDGSDLSDAVLCELVDTLAGKGWADHASKHPPDQLIQRVQSLLKEFHKVFITRDGSTLDTRILDLRKENE